MTRLVPISLGTTSILNGSISSASGIGAPVDFDRASRALSTVLNNSITASSSANSTGWKYQRPKRAIASMVKRIVHLDVVMPCYPRKRVTRAAASVRARLLQGPHAVGEAAVASAGSAVLRCRQRLGDR